ncbi:lipid-A-disaccharide synthase [Candidatus Calescamantes bacterium]|nr:lipid-A-disaccharide synthase [Candidatus Calescamantes bacterium]
MNKIRIFMVAGEESGDLHGSLLIQEIKKLSPGVKIVGMGGKKMQSAGMEPILELDEKISIVGFQEVLQNFRRLRMVYSTLARYLRENEYDVFIPIDYPGMNLRLSRVAKEKNLKVIYYISPQVWAWGEKRICWIKKYVDKIIVILPFEREFYEKRGIEACYVGHPLLDVVKPELREKEFREVHGLGEKPIIGLLPGSRESEVRRHIPLLLDLVSARAHRFSFALLKAKSLDENIFCRFTIPPQVKIISEHPYSLMKYSYILVVTSGTATLESAILGTPMIIIYQPSIITHLIVRTFLHIPHIGLVNLVAGETIIPELVSPIINKEAIIREVDRLSQKEENKRMRKSLKKVRDKLGESGAARRAAEIIIQFLREREVNFRTDV